MYLYRAVDSKGDTIDFYLSKTRNKQAAKRFFKKILAFSYKESKISQQYCRVGSSLYKKTTSSNVWIKVFMNGQTKHCRNRGYAHD